MGIFDLFREPNIDKMKGSNDVGGLLRALKHNQTFIREKAAKALGSLKDERAIESLVQALNDQSKEVQVIAAEALSLFDYSKIRHVWKYLDVKVRRGAIERLTDQAALAEIAKKETDKEIANVAVNKINDHALLADVARSSGNEYARCSAIKRVTDQAILAEVATKDSSAEVCREAMERITNQKILADIAKNDESWKVRRGAVERLTDQAIIAEVALYAKSSDSRKNAVKKLTNEDQTVLTTISNKDDDWDVRFYAAEKLVDQVLAQHVFAEVVKARSGLAKEAVAKLLDQHVLANIARDAQYVKEVRLKAVQNIENETLLAEIATDDINSADFDSGEFHLAAVAKVTDQSLLASIIRTAPTAPDKKSNFDTRLVALRKLRNIKLLAEISEKPSSSNLYWDSLLFDDGKIQEGANRKIRLLRNVRTAMVTDCPKWECVDCEEILDKYEFAGECRPGDPTNTISGVVKCQHCPASYEKADVYGGCYDVNAEKINVLVFCLRAFQSPSDTDRYCRHALGKKYQHSEMLLRTVVGLPDDYLSDYAAISGYRELVSFGKIKDHGRLYDRFEAIGPDGKKLCVLIFI